MDEMTPVREVVVNLLNELDACETGGDRISYLTKFLREFRSLPRAESEVVDAAMVVVDRLSGNSPSVDSIYAADRKLSDAVAALRKSRDGAGEG